jgi:hypothetical protein
MDARMVSTFVFMTMSLVSDCSFICLTNAHEVRDIQWWIVRRIEFVAALDDIRKNESGGQHINVNYFDREVRYHIYHS